MSLKKTWFSYVLWAVLAVLTGITTYIAVVKVLTMHPIIAPWVGVGAIAIFLIIHFLCGEIKQFVISKWMGRMLHIVIFLAITAAFILLRLPAVLDVANIVSSQQATWFFDASKVGRDVLSIAGMTSVLEQIYINLLSGVFLFLGNKIEVLLYIQVILQILSYIFLIFIGWTLQKGIYAWIPALLYAVSPFMYSAIENVGAANFWMCIVVFVLFLICMLQGTWKNRNITYIAVAVIQILLGVIVFIIKIDVLWYGNSLLSTGGYLKGTEGILGVEMFIAVIALIGYCVSFWFDKQDHRVLYVLPFVLYSIILTIAAFFEYETCSLVMMLAAINLYFLVAECMRVTFTFKPEVVTGGIDADTKEESIVEKETADFDWSEMKDIMHDNKTAETNTVTENVVVREEKVKEEMPVIDRTAPIENVLPMPKKHKPRILDYAFEPSEDMMHYDVEIENDEYDY